MYCGPRSLFEIKEDAEVCDKFVYDSYNTIKNLKAGDTIYIKRIQNLLPYVQQALVSKVDSDNTIWVTLEEGPCCKLLDCVSIYAVHNTYEHAYKAACLDILNSSLTLKEELYTELDQIQLKIWTNEKRIEKMRQEIAEQEDAK
jgi:hypothetical protein